MPANRLQSENEISVYHLVLALHVAQDCKTAYFMNSPFILFIADSPLLTVYVGLSC